MSEPGDTPDSIGAARRRLASAREALRDRPREQTLESLCSLLDAHTVVYDASSGLDLASFADAGLRCVPAREPEGANLLYLGGRSVVVSESAQSTAAWLEAHAVSQR